MRHRAPDDCAEVFLTIATKLTFPTENRGVNRNSLAYHLAGHVLANSVNDTSRLAWSGNAAERRPVDPV